MNSSLFTRFVPMLAVVGAIVALGVGTSAAKQLFPIVGAQGTTALRVGLSALVLVVLWRPWRWPLKRADVLAVLPYGLALGGMNLLFYLSIRTIPLGLATAIEFLGPLAVAVLASRRAVDFLWVAIAALGLGLLLPFGHDVRNLDPVGVLYALGAATCWGLYIVFGKRAGHLHAGHSVTLGLLVASLLVLPFGIAHAGSALFAPEVLWFGLGVAVVSSAIPVSLEMVALKQLSHETYSIMVSMEPAVLALIALPMLDEYLSPIQWFAIACTMLASVGSTLTARRDHHDPSAPQRFLAGSE